MMAGYTKMESVLQREGPVAELGRAESQRELLDISTWFAGTSTDAELRRVGGETLAEALLVSAR